MAEIDCAVSFTKKLKNKKIGSPHCGFLIGKSPFTLKTIYRCTFAVYICSGLVCVSQQSLKRMAMFFGDRLMVM